MKYEIFQLAEIDLANLKLIKDNISWYSTRDYSRWMFRSTRKSRMTDNKNLYFKIWNPTYVRRDNILTGIDIGFYDEQTTPALVGPILHGGICRGYVMRNCTKNWNLKLDEEFYRLIKQRSAETGYYHRQFSPYHMMRYQRCHTLIGLESLYPIPTMLAPQCSYKDYETFIGGLSGQRLDPHQPRGETPYFSKSPLLVRGARFLWSKARALLSQKRHTHIHVIER